MKYKKKGRWVAVVSIFLMISVGAVCLTNASEGKNRKGMQETADRGDQSITDGNDNFVNEEKGSEGKKNTAGEGDAPDGEYAATVENSEKTLAEKNSQETAEENGKADGQQVRIGIYRPESTAVEVSYYTPGGKWQKKLQVAAKKLDASHGSSKKERKNWMKEKELGYEVYFAGSHWTAYSGGWFSFAWAEKNHSGKKVNEKSIIRLPELYRLTEQIVREELDYEYVDVKEMKNLVSAELVYQNIKGKKGRQEITDAGQLKKIEALFSDAAVYMQGASACPFGDGILTLRRKDGRQFVLSLATDSCEVFRVNGVYYDYAAVHNGEENDLRNAKALMRIFCGIPWNW